MSSKSSCPCCASGAAAPFFSIPGQPVFIGVQWPSQSAARSCARGDLNLNFCPACGFIWNTAFDPARLEYSRQYDNALDYSRLFQQYAQSLVTRLVETYDVRHKEVVEIGCGKGRFLAMLCEKGDNRGIGFDPSYDGERWPSSAAHRITYVRDLYSDELASGKADLVCCRFVFEHIPQPLDFLKLIRRAIGDRTGTILYFEVPNVRLILDGNSPWDVIYEHCSYFGIESLSRVFQDAGFEVLRIDETYAGQFLGIDARPRNVNASGSSKIWGDLTDLQASMNRFQSAVEGLFAEWRKRLENWRQSGRKVVAWGAGAKAVSFLNMLEVTAGVPCVVDINPHKQGLHLAGTGQQIVSPGFLKEYRPDVVILMNPIYRQEIAEELHSLDVPAELVDAF